MAGHSSDALVDEEQFGPALPIIRYRGGGGDQAANASENGLGGSVWSSDIDHARHVAQRLECGSVWINKHGMIQPNVPFGGVDRRGWASSSPRKGLREYTDVQALYC